MKLKENCFMICDCNAFSGRREIALFTFIINIAQIHYHFPMATVLLYVSAAFLSLCSELALEAAVSIASCPCAFTDHIECQVIGNYHIVYGDGFG